MEEFDIILGKWLREKRETRNMTQQAVAERLGLTRGAVNRREQGNRSLNAKQLFEHCEVLGADINELVEIYKKNPR